MRLKHLLLLAVCFCVQASVVLCKDYYEILQLTKAANEQQLKRSYRKLALQYHPDKVTGTDEEKKAASQKFAEISHAYDVLSDPEKRRIYDQYGEEGLKQQSQRDAGGRGGGDPFDFFFGGGFGGRGEQEEEVRKGHTIYVDLYVTLRDLYVGKEIKMTRDKSVIKPASGTRKCKCKNKVITRQLGPGMFQQYQTQECETCQNVKLEREQEQITVRVEPGMVDHQQITFFEEGEPLVDGEPGDLVFVIKAVPNEKFERRGNDLMINQTITLVDALTGFSRDIEHLDGHTVNLYSETNIIRPGDYHMVPDEGMPFKDDPHKRGNLWVQYTVEFPQKMSNEQRQATRKLFADAF